MHHEFVLVDQSEFAQRQRELHACQEQSFARLLLELLDGLPEIAADELGVPIGRWKLDRLNASFP